MTNNKKPASAKPIALKGSVPHDWLTPIEAANPCGSDLEYDPEFVVLCAKVAARTEAQYGGFIGSPEPINWGDIERDCRRLMLRGKDIRLALLFTRCRTRLANAAGLAEGVGLLAAWLQAFPDAIHPQLGVDAERAAALEIRMNALQALTDSDGLLGDVREIALTKSTATRLQVRDIERAFAHPRLSDALAPESVTRQLNDLRAQQPTTLAGFDATLASLAEIDAWSREHLSLYAPDLSALTRLLRHLAGGGVRTDSALAENAAIDTRPVEANVDHPSDDALPAREVATLAPIGDAIRPRADAIPSNRHAALDLIRTARQWFEQHEPSSPIPLLLRRAEQLVGKRYEEVVQAIPSELLAQWSQDDR